MKILEKYGKKKIAIGAAIIIVAILAIVYVAIAIFFNSHFGFRTIINGVDCSGKTVADVEQIITAEIDKYSITIEAREEKSEVINSEDIALQPVFDGSLQQELKSRSGFAWPASLFKDTRIELDTMVAYDEEMFQHVVEQLDCMNKAASKEPKDAYISDYITGKGYEIIPEEEGTLVDKNIFEDVLHTNIINLQSTISLEENGCYEEPEVRADDEQLLATLEEMNAYVKAEITYEFGENTEVLDGEIIHTWLTVDENQKIVLDEEQAAAFVADLAAKYDTYGKTRSLKTTYGPTVSLGRNEYGWRIDREGELAQLLTDIKSGTAVSREAIFSQRAASFGANDHGGTYVEINLTAQYLYFYKNGKLILQTEVITGDPSKGWATPTGAYDITYTMAGKTLRGADYAVWVDYWMPFNGGVGLHDCNWHGDFGGNYYKTIGSHGCINMPPATAKTLFNNIKTGDAVFVYELPGTESAKAIAQDDAAAVASGIDIIGTVTLDSGTAIQNARTGYDALSDLAKSFITNLHVLEAAEREYAALTEAQVVIDAINAIGQVTILDQKPTVDAVRAQYNALSDAAKQKVTNLNVLEAAEAAINTLSAGTAPAA